ncbi:MAG: branched-chain-amino-acid transaminase [Fibromonadaceae bacterium]|jgi:branched-chain amino acid aminotransferase|nr:branched-chain-amino-acid transaminase [Fibromonadaceae bacterium]
MPSLVYINGEFYDRENAKVSVFDHGFLYGDGVFEGVRAYKGMIFRLTEHVDRLFDSAKVIGLIPGIQKKEMEDIIVKTCAKAGMKDGYIRPIISRGIGDLGLNPYLCKKPNIICIVDNISLYPPEDYENGLKIITVATHRNYNESLNPRVKSLNYLNNIMAKIEAVQSGVKEALLLNPLGYVAECTGDNLFIVRKGKIYTPSVQSGSLDGITAAAVAELAVKRGFEVIPGLMSRFDIWTSDECWLTGTAAEMIPVTSVDARLIGDGKVGPVYKQLLADFKHLTETTGTPIV